MTEVEDMSEWERVAAAVRRRLVGAPVAMTPSRTITAVETRKWLERLGASPNDALCDDVAGRLTKIRWPSDPTSPAAGCDDETDQWWDFQAAIKAANTLNAAFPAMLSHWDGLQWAPETRGGYEAIKALDTTLSLAMPYIEFPFGKYERKTHRHRHRPKDWHMAAIVIAKFFIEAMIKSGGKAPSTSRVWSWL